MEINELIQQLASAIHHWLSYVSLCTNSNLLAENSVKYPFVEYIERKNGVTVVLEKTHPDFTSRHLDFWFKVNKCPLFVELKYTSKATRGKKEIQRVFDDLIRLSLALHDNPNARCFFIMCGETITFKNNFKSIIDGRKYKKNIRQDGDGSTVDDTPSGPYAKWFGFTQDEEVVIDLLGDDDSYSHTKAFVEDYYSKDQDCSVLGFSSIKTIRVAYLPTGRQESRSQTVAIWEVLINKSGNDE